LIGQSELISKTKLYDINGTKYISAIEYAKKNITINCVSPGFIISDMTMNIAEKV